MLTNNIQPQQGKIELEGFEAMKTLMRRITQANPPYAALKTRRMLIMKKRWNLKKSKIRSKFTNQWSLTPLIHTG